MKNFRLNLSSVALIVACFAVCVNFSACSSKDRELSPAEVERDAVLTELSKDPTFRDFANALKTLDLSNVNASELTVLAIKNSSSRTGANSDFNVKRHVVIGRHASVNDARLTTINGSTLTIKVEGGKVYVNGVEVTDRLSAGNSEVWVVDEAMTHLPMEKGSVKWKITYSQNGMEQELKQVYTFDNYGKRVRNDMFMDHGFLTMQYITISNMLTRTCWLYGPDQYMTFGWSNMDCGSDPGTDANFQTDVTMDFELLATYRRLPDRMIAYKMCTVYEIKSTMNTAGTIVNSTTTYAFWEGLTMYVKIEMTITGGGTTPTTVISTTEAESVTLSVPATAFTQTTNITWHP